MAPVAPSPLGPEALAQGGGNKNVEEMGAVGRTDIGAYRPSLEILMGEDPELLQRLLAPCVSGLSCGDART